MRRAILIAAVAAACRFGDPEPLPPPGAPDLPTRDPAGLPPFAGDESGIVEETAREAAAKEKETRSEPEAASAVLLLRPDGRRGPSGSGSLSEGELGIELRLELEGKAGAKYDVYFSTERRVCGRLIEELRREWPRDRERVLPLSDGQLLHLGRARFDDRGKAALTSLIAFPVPEAGLADIDGHAVIALGARASDIGCGAVEVPDPEERG